MKVTIPDGLTGKGLYDFLIQNKSVLIAEKKYNVKHADAFGMSAGLSIDENGVLTKAATPSESKDTIEVTSIINTTFWFDSHKDVHIDGLWKKSLSENKGLYLLQEHSMTFKGIISDEVRAFTRKIAWKALGVNAEGETEALVFVSQVKENRNTFMFNEYRMGHVKNHSVGMRYDKIELAINDEDYKEEFAIWGKFIDRIANKNEVEEAGYFWAVKEARAVEGSAVPIGSNIITPTQSVKSDTSEQPSIDTVKEPSQGTFDIKQLLQIF